MTLREFWAGWDYEAEGEYLTELKSMAEELKEVGELDKSWAAPDDVARAVLPVHLPGVQLSILPVPDALAAVRCLPHVGQVRNAGL